mmetsp:Transcript_5117/g.12025  ORF Transcript_5117/g.12025 Transcript_5117/m.12025 type:complete len:244 (-) Transcript_5117:255-986(-)
MLEAAHSLLVVGQALLRHRKVALGIGLGLLLQGQVLLCLRHVVGCKLDLILKRLLQHLKIVFGSCLPCPRFMELLFGFVQQVLKSVNDVAAVALVDRWVRRTKGRIVLVALGALHQSCQCGRVLGSNHGGVDHGFDGLQNVRRLLELHHGTSTLAHLPFQHTNGPLQCINDIDQLLLRCNKVRVLSLADLVGSLQVCLVCRQAGRCVLDFRTQRGCRARGPGNCSLQILGLSLCCLDLVLQIP